MAAVSKKRKKARCEEDVRELLYHCAAEAVAVLQEITADEELKPELRIKAAENILDRVCGKASGAQRRAEGESVVSVAFEGVLEEWSR